MLRSGRITASIMLLVVVSCGGGEGGGSTTTALPTTTQAAVATTVSPTTSVPASTTTTLLDTTTEVVSEAPPGSVQVELSAPPAPRFLPDELTAPPSDAVFFLVNTAETGTQFATHTLAFGLEQGHAIARSDDVLPGTSASYMVRGLSQVSTSSGAQFLTTPHTA